MARKVIIDCDPGTDDAVALCLALFEPRLEVISITAVAGNVSAEQASRNVQSIVEQLDPPRLPRLGTATALETAPALNLSDLHGNDGLGNASFAISQLHHQHPSEKIISDEIRSAPGQVTLVCLGPLTNVARAFTRDPALAAAVDRIIMVGGTIQGVGDVTAAAEFNLYYDPISARTIFQSPTTKTLVPLDVNRQVRLTMDLIEQIPDETSRAGRFLRHVLPFMFRAYHQKLGQESIHLHGCVALLSILHPELFTTTDMAADVEVRGELTTGVTVFDRRPHVRTRHNMEVATAVDAAAAKDCIVRGLTKAGQSTE